MLVRNSSVPRQKKTGPPKPRVRVHTLPKLNYASVFQHRLPISYHGSGGDRDILLAHEGRKQIKIINSKTPKPSPVPAIVCYDSLQYQEH